MKKKIIKISKDLWVNHPAGQGETINPPPEGHVSSFLWHVPGQRSTHPHHGSYDGHTHTNTTHIFYWPQFQHGW